MTAARQQGSGEQLDLFDEALKATGPEGNAAPRRSQPRQIRGESARGAASGHGVATATSLDAGADGEDRRFGEPEPSL